MNKLVWVKSSYSGGSGGNCIEVADQGSRVLVRDTKDTAGPMLRFTPDAWRSFAGLLKADRSLSAERRPDLPEL
jgi:hypothetical protein